MLKKVPVLGIWICYVLMFLNAKAEDHRAPFKDGTPDLEVTSLKITSVRGNTAYIDYVVTNTGTRAMEMSTMQYKLYASSQSTFDPATAAPSGSGLFSEQSYILEPGEQLMGSVALVVPAQVSIELMHFLYFSATARDGYPVQESNLSNNMLITDSALAEAELSMQVHLTSRKHDTLIVHYTLQNTGNRPLYLSPFQLQTFVSEDALLTASDSQTYLGSFSNNNVLYPGQYWDDLIYTATAADFSQTPYLLVKMGLAPGKTHTYLKNTSDTAVINVQYYYPDIALKYVAADSVTGNRVNYSGLVYNRGGGPIEYESYDLRVFLSRDSVLSIEEDRMISTQILSTPDYYRFTSSFDAPLDLKEYPYLILQVQRRQGLPDNGDDLSNNQQSYYIPEVFTDVKITDFNTSYDESNLYYDYTISAYNRSVHLDRFEYSLYLSEDSIYDEEDTLITTSGFTDTVIYNHFRYSNSDYLPLDLYDFDYSYVIMKVNSIGVYYEQTDSNNEEYSFPIPMITDPWPGSGTYFRVSQSSDQVTMESKNTESQSNYILYTTNGEKLMEGQFAQQQQIDTSTLKNGLYLLKLANDNGLQTSRIVVQH